MDKEEDMPDGYEGEDDFFAPEEGSVDWGNTDPEVIFQKRTFRNVVWACENVDLDVLAGLLRSYRKDVSVNDMWLDPTVVCSALDLAVLKIAKRVGKTKHLWAAKN